MAPRDCPLAQLPQPAGRALVTPRDPRCRLTSGGLNGHGLVLLVLPFDDKDLLSGNRHHVSKVLQDDCGHTRRAGEARAPAAQAQARASHLTCA